MFYFVIHPFDFSKEKQQAAKLFHSEKDKQGGYATIF